MEKGICKLCKKKKELCNQSHIIPDFMYQDLLVEKGKMIKAQSGKRLEKAKSIQTGDFDKHILCEDCDNRVIGQYESYASKVLYGGKIPLTMENFKAGDHEYMEVKNINYKKFKLFLLSILWRASISDRDFFSEVSLGPYEEQLRRMVLNGDAGNVNEFPFIIRAYRSKTISEIVASPIKKRINNNITYKFQINKFEYIFKVSKNKTRDFFSGFTINKDNNMKIIYIPEKYIEKYIEKISNNFV